MAFLHSRTVTPGAWLLAGATFGAMTLGHQSAFAAAQPRRVSPSGEARAQGASAPGDDPDQDPDEQRSRRGRFADGFFTGRFRRHGLFSSLTLGFSNCVDGKGTCNGTSTDGSSGRTKSSFAFTKEFGFRIPWVFFGASYSLGFMKPDWTLPVTNQQPYKWAYQHSLLGVIRPTLPLWRIDLGLTLAPGWSRQVFRTGIKRDRTFTQGFAFGVGGVASVYITRGWIVGLRSDIIMNFHNTACAVVNKEKQCAKVGRDSISGVNTAIHGLYLSHRW